MSSIAKAYAAHAVELLADETEFVIVVGYSEEEGPQIAMGGALTVGTAEALCAYVAAKVAEALAEEDDRLEYGHTMSRIIAACRLAKAHPPKSVPHD